MKFVQRAWLVLIFLTGFLIFCVAQLDRSKKWLWHLVFIPLWILDAVIITSLIVLLIMHYKTGHNPYPDLNLGKRRKIWLLYLTLLKLTFLLTLCARLDGLIDATYVQIFIPLWLLLVSIGADAIIATVHSVTHPNHREWRLFGCLPLNFAPQSKQLLSSFHWMHKCDWNGQFYFSQQLHVMVKCVCSKERESW